MRKLQIVNFALPAVSFNVHDMNPSIIHQESYLSWSAAGGPAAYDRRQDGNHHLHQRDEQHDGVHSETTTLQALYHPGHN